MPDRPKKRTNGRRENPDTWGDPNFAGNGKLTCLVCGLPYRDHRIGACTNKPNNAIVAERNQPKARI